tara:strand:- start:1237 stop:1398 length:162 start_codon:yes stop_codon:yes gene_type:complete
LGFLKRGFIEFELFVELFLGTFRYISGITFVVNKYSKEVDSNSVKFLQKEKYG